MRRGGRWASGVAALLSLGSCVEPRAKLPPVAITVPPPVPQALPVPLGEFVLKGSLIQGGVVIGQAPAYATRLSFNGADIPLAADGAFVIAFDRDAPGSAMLAATLSDGAKVSRAISVSPREWSISRLSTLPKYPLPIAQFKQLRPAELAQINAARRVPSTSEGWRQAFMWPTTGRISTLFGSQRSYKNGEMGSYHSGIDIAVPNGTPILSPADGVVILASDHAFTLEGNLLLIDHGMGINSAMMHLSRIVVATGQAVKRGQLIAYSGATGRVTGAHLHWTLRWRDAKVDPLLVAGPMPR